MSPAKAPVLSPSAIPQVALESMNQTHREEVDLVNRLADLLTQGQEGKPNNDAITNCLNEWVMHTREHFERENQLMRDYGFPAYPIHSGEHTKVLNLILALQQGWREQQDAKPLADFLIRQWPQWFDMHVNSMDAITAQFVSQQGGR